MSDNTMGQTSQQQQIHHQGKKEVRTSLCPTCARENRSGANYCRFCGAIMPQKSPQPPALEQSHPTVNKKPLPTDYISLAKVREALTKQKNLIKLQKERVKRGMGGALGASIFMFRGDTGTGKTLVASCFIKELKDEKCLDGDRILEKSAKELSTLLKNEFEITKHLTENNYAALVIDEIHGDTNYLHELLLGLSKLTTNCICILLGLRDPLIEYFNKNPEDVRRIAETFEFPNQTDAELVQILKNQLAGNKITYAPELEEQFIPYIQESRYDPNCMNKNGWLIEKDIVPAILKRQAERLSKLPSFSDSDISCIATEDLPLGTKRRSINEILAELDEMIGLGAAKKAVREIADTIVMQGELEEQGIKGQKQAVHLVFTGNPGTGKTTVARMLGQLFRAIGLLPSDKVIEVDRSNLVASYVGQTVPQVNQCCDKAMGGILFIDEAYTLSGGKEGNTDSFGQEAIDTLLKRMEDDRGCFVVIAAGYKNEMKRFIESNPGLKSRFTHFIDLEDYNPDELFAIYSSIAKKSGLILDTQAGDTAREAIEELYRNRGKDFANGRTIRNLFDETIRKQSGRLTKLEKEKRTKETITLITAGDIPYEKKKVHTVEEILAELDGMIGLAEVKKIVRAMARKIQMQKEREEKGIGEAEREAVHIVFTGNPGTGKTTVARKLGKLFHAMKLLPDSKVIEVDRSQLVASYVGQTGPQVNKACDSAMGGILFIDEAYALISASGHDEFGQEAVNTLLKRMEDDRGKYTVIAAGYKNEMDRFIESNPGLKSRFTHFIHLEDYNPDELSAIYQSMAKQNGYTLTEEAQTLMREAADKIYRNRGKYFANGRTMRNYFDETRRRLAGRVSKLERAARTKEVLTTVTANDIPITSAAVNKEEQDALSQ
jgi:SpoVK/Ycf46/Vps4 family AAA+-type ATPase